MPGGQFPRMDTPTTAEVDALLQLLAVCLAAGKAPQVRLKADGNVYTVESLIMPCDALTYPLLKLREKRAFKNVRLSSVTF